MLIQSNSSFVLPPVNLSRSFKLFSDPKGSNFLKECPFNDDWIAAPPQSLGFSLDFKLKNLGADSTPESDNVTGKKCPPPATCKCPVSPSP